MKYPRIVAAVFGEPWAIKQDKAEAIAELVAARATDMRLDVAAGEYEAARRHAGNQIGSVAVIPIYGVISQRMNLLSAFSGGTSVEQLSADIKEAANSDNVSSIVLDIDSPGGSVFGIQELSEQIYNARQEKRIVAIANSTAASAAYWLGSSASEFVVTPSGEVGSIGVIMMHVDQSKLNEKVGVDVTYITAGEYKAEGNPDEPLSDDAMEFLQSRVDDYYSVFVANVARNRAVSESTVREDFGKGRAFGAQMALQAGMVDGIETFDDVLARLQPKRSSRARRLSAQSVF